MNVYRPNPAEVRQGAAHWAAVRGIKGPKAPKAKAVRAAIRAGAETEVLAETRGYDDRLERVAGADRFGAVMRHSDRVRGITRTLPAATIDDDVLDAAVRAGWAAIGR